MAIPESIKKLANDIRTKIYGREVREALASGIEAAGSIANDADVRSQETETKQTNLEKKYDEQIANMSLENPSVAEVVDARVSGYDGQNFDTIGKRMDKVDAQLARTSNEIVEARGGETVLKNRLDKVDQKYQDITTQLAHINTKVSDIETRIPLNFKKVKFIGHRGYSGIAPENSLLAFDMTGTNRGAFWGCETDIRQTSDGRFVCMHDDTIDRTTTGTGSVANLTFSQIRQHKIDLQAILTRANQVVPTLEEYLEVMTQIDVVPIIEIKAALNWQNFVNIIRNYGFEDKCIVISGSQAYLQSVRDLSKKIKMMYLCNAVTDTEIQIAKAIGNCGINTSTVSKEVVQLVHGNGLEIGMWTLDDITIIENAIKYGVDYITTNNGAGRFINKFKRITLTKSDTSNSLAVSQQYSSEYVTMSWDEGRNAVYVKFEYPFTGFPGEIGTSAFLSVNRSTKDLGYTFATATESFMGLYLTVYKNGSIINPLTSLTDVIWISMLVFKY